MRRSDGGERYADRLTLLAARALFFERAGLGPDGGYGARWVRVEARPVPVYFPNTRCRVEAAKLHDLHHVATEYGTDWPGEAEVAAWELAGGCGRHGWAWLLDLGAFAVGMVLVPRRLFRAFVRGRRSTRSCPNLYRAGLAEAQLGAVTVGALRERLGVRAAVPVAVPVAVAPVRTRGADVAAFAGWCLVAVLWHAAAGLLGALAARTVARRAGLL